MKIKAEHFEILKVKVLTAFNNMGGDKLVVEYSTGDFPRSNSVKDLNKRFCFDVFYASGANEWFCNNCDYLDSNHLYTALKSILPTVIRKF